MRHLRRMVCRFFGHRWRQEGEALIEHLRERGRFTGQRRTTTAYACQRCGETFSERATE